MIPFRGFTFTKKCGIIDPIVKNITGEMYVRRK